MEKLVLLLFSVAAALAQSKNPCQGMTLGDCRTESDNIVDQSTFPPDICAESCKMSDNCHFWRAFQDEGMEKPECLHLRTNYHRVSEAESHKKTALF